MHPVLEITGTWSSKSPSPPPASRAAANPARFSRSTGRGREGLALSCRRGFQAHPPKRGGEAMLPGVLGARPSHPGLSDPLPSSVVRQVELRLLRQIIGILEEDNLLVWLEEFRQ